MTGALRAGALVLMIALLINPSWGALRASRPQVALDVSLSWLRGTDSAAWFDARRLAEALGGDSVLLVGSTLRIGAPPAVPTDTSARMFDAAERAQLVARPLTLITDGELREDASRLRASLPAGSRTEVVAPARLPDVGIVDLETPPAALAGDSVTLRVRVAAAQETPAAVELVGSVDGRVHARRDLQPLAAWESRTELLTLRLPSGPVEARVAVVVSAPGDGEPRNDSASRTIHRGQRMTGLAVSTAPDFDFREIVRVMRGALSVPAGARFRVAPDRWVDDSGRVIGEAQLRIELGRAHVVVLHGDTAYFGAPRAAVRGALALIPTPTDDTEWYFAGAPPSPVAPILAALPFDSLPPVAVGPPPRFGTPLVEVRAPAARRRVAAALEEGDRRVIVVPVRGTARWALRGGVAGDAFATFWGALIAALADRPGSGIRTSAATLPLTELHPRRPVLEPGVAPGAGTLRRGQLRGAAWPYVMIVLLLCAEWVLRRRAGLR
ncbi:MAG TPA: hypothetical protein VMM17_08255 [Gemmatimonadaceae bacterium]|nr:hypothetical protein [Gemmatimonadaceae bacterium]